MSDERNSTTRRREPPEPMTVLREEYNALVYVFELAKQWVEANEIDDRPNRNEAEAFLPGAVKRAKEAMAL